LHIRPLRFEHHAIGMWRSQIDIPPSLRVWSQDSMTWLSAAKRRMAASATMTGFQRRFQSATRA